MYPVSFGVVAQRQISGDPAGWDGYYNINTAAEALTQTERKKFMLSELRYYDVTDRILMLPLNQTFGGVGGA